MSSRLEKITTLVQTISMAVNSLLIISLGGGWIYLGIFLCVSWQAVLFWRWRRRRTIKFLKDFGDCTLVGTVENIPPEMLEQMNQEIREVIDNPETFLAWFINTVNDSGEMPVNASFLEHRQRMSSNINAPGAGMPGKTTCKYHSDSGFVHCAVNPTKTCEGCKDFEPRL
jgi:Family of unknown function (DUF6464)